eukprot:TRINITY_DN30420_c0_g1_i1.p1 TRINITY_DN30420_c0_g1~~TRINITY_DN30420_c0_g1_i1.p1  ORF type:complete len:270 (-),score=73.68 TRINITY_DN30420_c0_g1_i1:149-958(-)
MGSSCAKGLTQSQASDEDQACDMGFTTAETVPDHVPGSLDDWSDDERWSPDPVHNWSLAGCSKVKASQEYRHQTQGSIYRWLVQWSDGANLPEFPQLQVNLSGFEPIDPEEGLKRRRLRPWREVHPGGDDLLEREYGEHVASCIGIALDQMLGSREGNLSCMSQSEVKDAVGEMGKYMTEISADNLIQHMADALAESQLLIEALDQTGLEDYVVEKDQLRRDAGTASSADTPHPTPSIGSVQLEFRRTAESQLSAVSYTHLTLPTKRIV